MAADKRVNVCLESQAMRFLEAEALKECRKPAQLARLLILQGLRARGLKDDQIAVAIGLDAKDEI